MLVGLVQRSAAAMRGNRRACSGHFEEIELEVSEWVFARAHVSFWRTGASCPRVAPQWR